MKKNLLSSIIADILKPASEQSYSGRTANITRSGSYLQNFLPKVSVITLSFIIVSLLFANTAFGATIVTGISAGSQTGTATYGTAASPTYTISLTRGGSNNGSDNMSLTWTGATPSGVTPTFNPTSPYNPKSITTVTLTLATIASTAAGSYPFKITNVDGNGGGTTTTTGTLVIGTKALIITATGPSKTYGTTLSTGATGINFTATGEAAGENVTSVTLTPNAAGLSASTAAGAAYIVTPSAPTGTGGFLASNYSITFNNYNGTVAKAALTVTANNQTKTYGSTFTFAGTEFTTSGLKNSDAVTSATLTSSGSVSTASAGSYNIVPASAIGAGLSNYTIIYSNGTMTVNKITLTVTGLAASDKIYNGNTTATLAGGTLNGVIAADIANVTLVPSGTFASKNVGSSIAITSTSTLSGTAAGNYTLTQPSVSPANITAAPLTINANDINKTYGTLITGGTGSTAFTKSGLVGSETINSVTIAYSTGAAATASVGTYSASVTVTTPVGGSGFVASNYAITYTTGDIIVGQAPLSVTANNVTKTYGTAITGGSGSTAFTANGLKNGETIGSVTIAYGTGAAATAGANTYNNQVTASAATGGTFNPANYTAITYNTGNITVNQANLTITATGPKTYGSAVTTFGYSNTFFTYTGTVNGETVTSVFFFVTGSGAGATAAAGTSYSIFPSDFFGAYAPTGGGGFNANNYNITWVSYSGSVAKAPLTITANNINKTYGTTLTGGTGSTAFTSSGLQNGQTIGSVTIAYGTGAAASDAVATYNNSITPSAATGGTFNTNNYTITYAQGNITVGQALLTVTANAVNKPFGTTLTSPAAGSTAFTAVGLAGGETIGSVTMTYTTGIAASDPIGTTGSVTPSAATGGTFTAGNYNITYTGNTLTVAAATFDWTGAVSADWTNPGNWSINGVQQTTNYPGLNEATDIAEFGVVSFANDINLGSALPNPLASLAFGGSSSINLTLGTGVNLTVTGNTTLNAGTETVNLIGASGSSLNVQGNYATGANSTFNNNSNAAITIGGAFTNAGTSNFGTALLTFNTTNNPVTFTTSTSQLFTNVLFTGGGHILLKKSGSGQYAIASTGILTMDVNETLSVANAPLILLSDANSSAAIAPIPANSSISGNVSVQRYMSAQRGYRLMSSPVYASTVGSNNVYSLNYVKNAAYITGTTGTTGGFDKAGNPTLYLYREDVIASNLSFLTGNYRGISDITAAPTYSLNNEASTFNIPSGNGFLFYFRGSRNQKSLAQLTTAGAAGTTDTLTATGNLNQGQVIFKDWYNSSASTMGYSNPDSTVRGFNLVGNPYASSIDWETFNTSSSNTGIYAQNVSDYVYELNPVTSNYDVYEAGTGGTIFTNNASRTIVSGQGFFVLALNGSAQLTFNESAKNTVLQNTGPNLYMGKPTNLVANNQFLKLQLAKDSINTDNVVISFNANAQNSFDMREDAPSKPGSGKVSLSSISSDRKLLAINRLPLARKGQTIPLKVGATADGTYSLNMSELKGIPQLYDVWLMDAYKKDSLDMKHNKTYRFDIMRTDTSSFGANRFTLVLRQNPGYTYHLLNFTAAKGTGRQVQLTWATENEDNYTNFTIERSTDGGKTFNIVGWFILCLGWYV